MIQESTLSYLKALNNNNNKDWFEKNRNKYEASRENFTDFIQQVIDGILKFDIDLSEKEAKKCLFRQHRDIRFSKDKTPYKPHFGAHMSRGGKSSNFAGYYFHLQPGNKSLAGGGIWMPEPTDLKKIRQEIDYSFTEFDSIIKAKAFQKHYKGLEDNSEYMLVNIPKGYDKENPAAHYLRFKSIVATRYLSDEELTKPGLAKTVVNAYEALLPLVRFINRALE